MHASSKEMKMNGKMDGRMEGWYDAESLDEKKRKGS